MEAMLDQLVQRLRYCGGTIGVVEAMSEDSRHVIPNKPRQRLPCYSVD